MSSEGKLQLEGSEELGESEQNMGGVNPEGISVGKELFQPRKRYLKLGGSSRGLTRKNLRCVSRREGE